MGLETFDFIPDLVDTNPTPTDPVAQGDDHLRGIKFTLQNQFPAIGENAVDLTALQINDAALQSASNIFSGPTQVFNGTALRFQAVDADSQSGALWIGTAASIRWDLKRESDNEGGDLILDRYDNNGTLQSTPFVLRATTGAMISSSGTAADPQYAFQSSTNMGMYRLAAGILGFAVAGIDLVRFSANAIDLFGSNARIRAGDAPAGNSQFEAGLLGDNSAFTQGRIGDGSQVSWVLRADVGGASYVGAFSAGALFGVATSTPARTFHVAGAGATAMRVTGLPQSSAGLSSGDFYAKQSQLFAPTETLVAMVP